MTTIAADILYRARLESVDISVRGDRVVMDGPSDAVSRWLPEVKAHKQEILDMKRLHWLGLELHIAGGRVVDPIPPRRMLLLLAEHYGWPEFELNLRRVGEKTVVEIAANREAWEQTAGLMDDGIALCCCLELDRAARIAALVGEGLPE